MKRYTGTERIVDDVTNAVVLDNRIETLIIQLLILYKQLLEKHNYGILHPVPHEDFEIVKAKFQLLNNIVGSLYFEGPNSTGLQASLAYQYIGTVTIIDGEIMFERTIDMNIRKYKHGKVNAKTVIELKHILQQTNIPGDLDMDEKLELKDRMEKIILELS